MQKLVLHTALACTLAAMSSIRAYACPSASCATPEEATTPAVVCTGSNRPTSPETKAPVAVAPTQVAAPCDAHDCATPEQPKTQAMCASDTGGHRSICAFIVPIVILTRPDLLRLEQVPCRDIEPAGTCLHQLIAGDGGRSRLVGTRNARSSDNYHKKRHSHW